MRGPDSALDRRKRAQRKSHRIPSEHKEAHFSCEGSDTGTGGPERLQSLCPWKCSNCLCSVLCVLLHVDSLGLFVIKQRFQACRVSDFNLWR